MKLITKDLLKFAAVASVLTLIFRYFLSLGIDVHSLGIILITCIFYSMGMFLAGMYWGKKDHQYLPIFDLGFRFHCCTFIIHQVISYAWLSLGFASAKENDTVFFSVLYIWGAVLLMHACIYFWTRQKAYKNLNKRDLFE